MLVRDIMTTDLITVRADETLSHAATLLRQHQFHHLPVVETIRSAQPAPADFRLRKSIHLLQGVLTSEDITIAVAQEKQLSASEQPHQLWQSRRIGECMHRAAMRVSPTTAVAAAAQLLVERGLNSLPVVEYERLGDEVQTVLVGLLTRSDLLLVLARALGAFEPGMQLSIRLPQGDLSPLAQALMLAHQLHVQVRSVLAAPLEGSNPREATLRLGTINPTPLLVRLQEAHIAYTFADSSLESDQHD